MVNPRHPFRSFVNFFELLWKILQVLWEVTYENVFKHTKTKKSCNNQHRRTRVWSPPVDKQIRAMHRMPFLFINDTFLNSRLLCRRNGPSYSDILHTLPQIVHFLTYCKTCFRLLNYCRRRLYNHTINGHKLASRHPNMNCLFSFPTTVYGAFTYE